MTLTASQLIQIYGIKPTRATVWQPHLAAAMEQFDINTPQRAAAFIAQIGHESGRLAYVKEIWDPEKVPAQKNYEGSIRLGNTVEGDGERFMGRSPVQITGRKNYKLVGDALGVDFVAQPQLLERVDYGAQASAWFWKFGAGLNLGQRALRALDKYGMGLGVNLNDIADMEDFETITICINGGLNGYEERCKLFARAKEVFGISTSEVTNDQP